MTATEVTAKRNPYTKKDKAGKETKMPGGTVKASIDFGSNLAECIKNFGENAVYRQVIGALTVSFQGWLRSQLDQGKSQAEITTAAKDWKPGERKQGKSAREKLMEQLAGMSAEERAALIREAASAKAPAPAPEKPAPAGNSKPAAKRK